MKRKTILITGAVVLLLAIGILLTVYYYPEQNVFSRTSLLKLNIPLNGESINSIKITNYEKTEQNFKIYFHALDDIGSVDEGEFALGAGEKKEIKVYFRDNKNEVGVYVGQLIIETETARGEIPVILGIEDPNYAFAIIQSGVPKYDNVYPGGKLGIEVKVYDVGNVVPPTVEAKYYIKNFDNEVILSDEVNLVVDGSKTEIIDIPKTWLKEDYVFITEIDYKGTKSIAGYLFSVTEKTEGWLSGDIKFFVIVILVFVVGILALFVYFIKTRDDLLLQLKRQQSEELRKNLELFRGSRRELEKVKDVSERKEKIGELEKVKKRIVVSIKKKQRVQRKNFKVLKKQKRKEVMKTRLSAWKSKGYKMLDTKKEISKISKQAIGKQMKDFKEGGYATGFLKAKK